MWTVMDGHFVPNITIGPMVVKALKPHAKIPFDVHLMITPVDPFVDAYVEARRRDHHVPSGSGPASAPARSRRSGKPARRPACRSIPARPVAAVEELLEDLDLVLVMSVNPGFGGQKFIDSQLRKIEALRKRIDADGQGHHPRGRWRRHSRQRLAQSDFRRRHRARRRHRRLSATGRKNTRRTSPDSAERAWPRMAGAASSRRARGAGCLPRRRKNGRATPFYKLMLRGADPDGIRQWESRSASRRFCARHGQSCAASGRIASEKLPGMNATPWSRAAAVAALPPPDCTAFRGSWMWQASASADRKPPRR